MKKGLYYSGALFAVALLGASETLADNPLDWGPYEREETSDKSTDVSSQQSPEGEREVHPE